MAMMARMARDPVETGKAIARRRHQLDMRQKDLAQRLGVAISTVANWERGKSFPERHWGAVEEVLGISLSDGQTEPEVPTDPEERALWDALDYMDPPERWRVIGALRQARDQAATG